jgi:hypothetical protein
MLTFEDCLELCELTEDEVDAIAQHEQLSWPHASGATSPGRRA